MFAGLLILIAWFVKDWLSWDHLAFTTTGDEAMLLGAQNAFLGKSQFQDLSGLVIGHAFLERLLFSMVANDDTAAVRTWASFNVDGQRKVCFTSDIRGICPGFFNNVKLDGANTWVLKVPTSCEVPCSTSMNLPFFSITLSAWSFSPTLCLFQETPWGQCASASAGQAWATSQPSRPLLKAVQTLDDRCLQRCQGRTMKATPSSRLRYRCRCFNSRERGQTIAWFGTVRRVLCGALERLACSSLVGAGTHTSGSLPAPARGPEGTRAQRNQAAWLRPAMHSGCARAPCLHPARHPAGAPASQRRGVQPRGTEAGVRLADKWAAAGAETCAARQGTTSALIDERKTIWVPHQVSCLPPPPPNVAAVVASESAAACRCNRGG